MESTLIRNKVQLLFDKIVEPGYAMNNYYADGLINKLANHADPDIAILDSLPLISDLLIKALVRTETIHITVKVFLIRLLGIESKNELHFTKICPAVETEILKDFNEILSPETNASLRVAYLEVALALTSHDSGAIWLLKSGVWRKLLNLCNEKQTIFVVRETYKFAAKFLWKLNDSGDADSVKLVLSQITKPIHEYDLLNVQSLTSDEEELITKAFEPMLQMLLAIIKEDARITQSNIIARMLLEEDMLMQHLYIIIDRMRGEHLTYLTAILAYWLTMAKVFLVKPMTKDVQYRVSDIIDIGVVYFNCIQMFATRRAAKVLLDFCNACNLILAKIFKDIPITCNGTEINVQNKLLVVCMVPCLTYVKHGSKEKQFTNERLEEFFTRFLSHYCEVTIRAGYAVRDLTLDLDVLAVTLQSVKRLTCLKDHVNNEQANLIFQALFYVLQEYAPEDEEGGIVEENLEESQDKVHVMTYILDIVLSLVKKYDINWHESLEVICLYTVVYNILRRPNLSPKFIVLALNVIAVTIKKFLPPNLSLLLETKPGSAMHELGRLIYLKLHDMHWEVRDSALELLLECTEISYIKFPPFQKQIIENKLINVAAALALHDHEYYVQVSALKCIGAAASVATVWAHLTNEYHNIQDRMISILRNNQEGVVRKEACMVLCSIYHNVKTTQTFKATLYEHLVSTAISDFHWEAQLNALKFWQRVMCSLLNDQGMLDGTFPPVTFSRETRKIVTLNEPEIQKRLIRVLDELSAIGCLTVLVKLLHEDTEVDIMESALNISMNLLKILNQYKVPEILKSNDDEPKNIEELLAYIVEETTVETVVTQKPKTQPESSDNVIDQILKADDMHLLSGIYESHMSINGETIVESSCVPKIKLHKRASPYFFVNYVTSKDFQAILEERRKWKQGIRSVSSLLDDVLGIYEVGDDDVNTLDCY